MTTTKKAQNTHPSQNNHPNNSNHSIYGKGHYQGPGPEFAIPKLHLKGLTSSYFGFYLPE